MLESSIVGIIELSWQKFSKPSLNIFEYINIQQAMTTPNLSAVFYHWSKVNFIYEQIKIMIVTRKCLREQF